jgi:colanic acid/amylovoran biosynthesis protein
MQKKSKVKILIPNATSPKNLGDLSMLVVLIKILKTVYKNPEIIVHSMDSHLHSKNIASRVDQTLYGYTIFSNRNPFVRVIKLAELFFKYFLYKFNLSFLFKTKLDSLIEDYKSSNLIIFVGNGNIRSKKGLTQGLNLVMMLMLFQFAKIFKAKKIVSPISFGPFGYSWQEKMAAKVIGNLDLVAARENISFDILRKNKVNNLISASDHALLTRIKKRKLRKKYPILGFTIREWLGKDHQISFEEEIILGLQKFAKKYNSQILPIIQVNAPEYGESDNLSIKRIVKGLKDKKVKVLQVKKATDIKSALNIYSNIDLLLGMRMHSNILAATQGTPFVSIAYEHKSEGITKQLKMDEFCIKCTDVNQDAIFDLLSKVHLQKNKLQKKLLKSVKKIQKSEMPRWVNLIQTI